MLNSIIFLKEDIRDLYIFSCFYVSMCVNSPVNFQFQNNINIRPIILFFSPLTRNTTVGARQLPMAPNILCKERPLPRTSVGNSSAVYWKVMLVPAANVMRTSMAITKISCSASAKKQVHL